jgi:hypothetical protein
VHACQPQQGREQRQSLPVQPQPPQQQPPSQPPPPPQQQQQGQQRDKSQDDADCAATSAKASTQREVVLSWGTAGRVLVWERDAEQNCDVLQCTVRCKPGAEERSCSIAHAVGEPSVPVHSRGVDRRLALQRLGTASSTSWPRARPSIDVEWLQPLGWVAEQHPQP